MVNHSSRIELSQSALKSNINFLKKKIGKDVKFSSVVKANAYGHGIDTFIPMLEKAGVDHFSVASAFEAEEIKNVASSDSDIMIMGILYDRDMEWVIRNSIEFYVFNLDRLTKARDIAKALGIKARIHLEVETGANRTGLLEKELPEALTFIKRNSAFIHFSGICTHFGGAESLANKFKIDQQYNRFNQALQVLKRKKMQPEYRHMASSAASIIYPHTIFDLVRVGVAQYGFWPSPEIYYMHLNEINKSSDKPLRRIITWKTDIMDVRPVKAGEFIGYGTAFQAMHDMVIAVLPLGYSNGYPRAQSNRGYVLIRGKRAPIVGLINMNLFMVDVSDIEGCEVGDEVVLIGRQKNNVINISSFTNFTQLLNNEMLSRLPAAIPRKAVK